MTKKIEEVETNSTYFTQQWLQPDVAKILQKSSVANPEFDVHFSEKEWHDDGDLVLIRSETADAICILNAWSFS